MSGGRGRPLRVVGMGATGVAEKQLGRPCEDTISLHVHWENLPSRCVGIASYTASWIAAPADVHSQQRFHMVSGRTRAIGARCASDTHNCASLS